jgi:hypothetical protein
MNIKSGTGCMDRGRAGKRPRGDSDPQREAEPQARRVRFEEGVEPPHPPRPERPSEGEYAAQAAAARANKLATRAGTAMGEFESDDEEEVHVVSGGAPEDAALQDEWLDDDPLERQKKKGKPLRGDGGDSSEEEGDDKVEDGGFDSGEDESDDEGGKAQVARVRGEVMSLGGGGDEQGPHDAMPRLHEGIVRVEGGVAVEAFNLDEERRHGYFEENFNYVRTRDSDDEEDAWLAQVDGQTAVLARKPARKEREQGDPREVASALAEMLQPGETVSRAMVRLKGQKGALGRLIDAANALMALGDVHIQERTSHDLPAVGEALWAQTVGREEAAARARQEQAQQASDMSAEALANPDSILWIYESDGKQFGPFSSTQMLQWEQQGYFDGAKVRCRQVSVAPSLEADLDGIGDDSASGSTQWAPSGPWTPASEVRFRPFAVKE